MHGSLAVKSNSDQFILYLFIILAFKSQRLRELAHALFQMNRTKHRMCTLYHFLACNHYSNRCNNSFSDTDGLMDMPGLYLPPQSQSRLLEYVRSVVREENENIHTAYQAVFPNLSIASNRI
jgi:hypothetical protein